MSDPENANETSLDGQLALVSPPSLLSKAGIVRTHHDHPAYTWGLWI